MIQSSTVSINLQDKGQVYIDGQSQQIRLFLQCLCFKYHPLMNLVQKYTFGFDEMSVLFSADQIRWMKVKQEQKYYFCHFYFLCITGSGSVSEISLKQIAITAQYHPLIYFTAGNSLFARKDTQFKYHRRCRNAHDRFKKCLRLLSPAKPFSTNQSWL